MKMDKKRIALLLIALFLLSSLLSVIVLAQTTDDEKVNKAYTWLIGQVKNKWQSLNMKQHVFSLLALNCNSTYFDPGNKSLYNKSFSSPTIRCWSASSRPSSEQGCLLTETAMAKVAIDTWKDNSTKVKNWLLSRNMTQVSGINWYLEIDVDRGYNASCEIIYGGVEENMFSVEADKTVKINGNSRCFTSYENPNQPYWFKIKPQADCYSYRYTIKCTSNATIYRATLLYKKPGSDVWYVSSQTESGKPGVPGSKRVEDQPNPLELQVPSYCLANPGQNSCDYEGTAWGAYALARQGDKDDANMLVPYLVVFSEANAKYFPASFLYPVTDQQRYNDEIIASQKIVGIDKGYWLIQPIVYGRVYDTAHAGLALGPSGGDAIAKAKKYLLANQETNGNLVAAGYGESQKESIRDTAFALWVFWGASCPGAGGGGGGEEDCESQGADFVCTNNTVCDPYWLPVNFTCPSGEICCRFFGAGGETECRDAGGKCKEECNASEFPKYDIYTCPTNISKCCKPYSAATCEEAGGELCSEEDCSGTSVETSDGTCCMGYCLTGGTENESCLDIGGEPCDTTQVCVNTITWNIIEFSPVKDTSRCCAGSSVKCVQDKSCSSAGGQECDFGDECSGTVEETNDVENCCVGVCKKSCSMQGGTVCVGDEKCSVSYIDAVEAKCCPSNGKCKKPVSLWWLWVLIILVVIGAGVYVYFWKFRKKKPKTKEEIGEGLFGLPMTRPPSRPVLSPISRPAPQAGPRPAARPMTQARPVGIARPQAQPAQRPRPLQKVPSAPTRAPKGKTEEELERTLSKLKKITSKK